MMDAPRFDRTTRPNATMPLPSMASRMTAKLSSATLSPERGNTGCQYSARRPSDFGDEAVYVDGVAALDCDCVELFVFYLQVDALIDS